MAILPVYTTSKLHAARINLRQTPSSTPGVLFNYVKGRGFGRKWAWFPKISADAQTRPILRTPLHDPPLILSIYLAYGHLDLNYATEAVTILGVAFTPAIRYVATHKREGHHWQMCGLHTCWSVLRKVCELN